MPVAPPSVQPTWKQVKLPSGQTVYAWVYGDTNDVLLWSDPRIKDLNFVMGAGKDAFSAALQAEKVVQVDLGQGDDVFWLAKGDATGSAIVWGGQGNDFMKVSAGAEFAKLELYGGADNDTIDFNASMGQFSWARGGAGNDTLNGGDGRQNLDGGENNDALHGGRGDDLLVGGTGSDLIYGGQGSDTLYGGNSNNKVQDGSMDTFVFKNISDSTLASFDTIIAFENGIDKIDLSGIDANTKTAGDQAFRFIGSAAFSKSAGELRWAEVSSGGKRAVDVYGDVNGDGIADFALRLMGGNPTKAPLAPAVGDFIL